MLEGLRLFVSLVRPKWPYFLLGTFLMSAAAAFQTAVPFAIGGLIDAFGTSDQSKRSQLTLFGGLSLGAFVALHLSALHSRYFVPRLRMFVQEQLFAFALSQPPLFFRVTLGGAVGDAIKQCGRTAVLIGQILTEDTVRLAAAFCVALTLLVLDGLWPLAFGLLVWAIIFFALAGLFAQSARPAIKEFSQASREVAGEIIDTLSNYDSIRTANAYGSEKLRIHSIMEEERTYNIKSRGKLILMSALHGGASWVLILAIAVYCSVSVPTQMTVGQAVTVITLSIVLSNLSQNFSRTLMDFFETLERFRDSYAALGVKLFERRQPITNFGNTNLPPHGEVPAFSLRDVYVGYADAGNPVLKGLSFDIPAGSLIGIVGGSGVGKSTLLDAMMNVLPIESGEIKIAGHAVDSLDRTTMANLISYVPQAPKLFARSLRDNLKYEVPDVSDEELWGALEASDSQQVVKSRKYGLGEQAGVEGRKLSVGERQRLVLTRALVADKPILLLDEPTSALDAVASNSVAMAIGALSERGKTIIYITHQLINTIGADTILVLKSGKIAQAGTHEELVNVQGPYRELWQRECPSFCV